MFEHHFLHHKRTGEIAGVLNGTRSYRALRKEAKSLAAQADRLIARGEFDKAERLLAQAERRERKAGLTGDDS